MKKLNFQKLVEGYVMEASIIQMPKDIHIVLTGGCCPHIGAVSIADQGSLIQSIQLEGHKDEVVSRKWAQRLSVQCHKKITVACGIHYDHADSNLLMEVIKQSEALLEEVILNLD